MKKLLTMLLGLGVLSQPAHAVSVAHFAGYANSLDSYGGAVYVDLGGPSVSSPAWDSTPANIEGNMQDQDASTWVVGYIDPNDPTPVTPYLDMSFNVSAINGLGNDLEVFLVGGNGHTFSITIGTETRTYSLAAGAGSTGELDTMYNSFPIVSMGINLDDFTTLSGPVTSMRMTIGDGWNCGADVGLCSAVPSFIGSYYAASTEIPIPAAAWLFGSGLIGLAGIARRKKA